jgi:hypothetical protein
MRSTAAPKVQFKVHFQATRRGKKRAVIGEKPVGAGAPAGNLPRVTRLMALAIRFEGLIREGEVRDLAGIARLGHVTRARVTQIMNLLHLAPDIQEALLNLPRVERGRDPVTERDLRPIAALVDWRKQRTEWRQFSTRTAP